MNQNEPRQVHVELKMGASLGPGLALSLEQASNLGTTTQLLCKDKQSQARASHWGDIASLTWKDIGKS